MHFDAFDVAAEFYIISDLQIASQFFYVKASLLGAALRYSWRGFVQGMPNGQGRNADECTMLRP